MKFGPLSRDRCLIKPIYHYRLVKWHQESGLWSKAIAQNKKILDIWKNADGDLPELVDATARPDAGEWPNSGFDARKPAAVSPPLRREQAERCQSIRSIFEKALKHER